MPEEKERHRQAVVMMSVENGTSVIGTTLPNNMQFLAMQFNVREGP